MKKLLLGTTAIVGASFMATAAMAKPEVRLGGFMNFQVGMTTQDHEGFGPSPGGVSATNPEQGVLSMRTHRCLRPAHRNAPIVRPTPARTPPA